MSSPIALEDGTVVRFEAAADSEFVPARGDEQVSGQVRTAVRPAVDAAREVLARVAEACPDEVCLKFGIKVSGQANWLVAKAASEANFEVMLTWRRPEETAGSS
ncbi:MAG: CU044_2847 family protein [Pseudonocardiaceae bacterium]